MKENVSVCKKNVYKSNLSENVKKYIYESVCKNVHERQSVGKCKTCNKRQCKTMKGNEKSMDVEK